MDASALAFLCELGKKIGKARFLVHHLVMNSGEAPLYKPIYDLIQIDMKAEDLIDIMSNLMIVKIKLNEISPRGTVIDKYLDELKAVIDDLV